MHIMQLKTKGKAPFIYGYAARIINAKLFIFGGQNQTYTKRLDIYVLDLKLLEWAQFDIIN